LAALFSFAKLFLQTRDKAFERLTESFRNALQKAFKARLKQPGAQLPFSRSSAAVTCRRAAH
jgi:hypothetical protein